jgi:hypothetical protein
LEYIHGHVYHRSIQQLEVSRAESYDEEEEIEIPQDAAPPATFFLPNCYSANSRIMLARLARGFPMCVSTGRDLLNPVRKMRIMKRLTIMRWHTILS